MPPPIPVHLVPHDPAWKSQAAAEGARLQEHLGPTLLTVHHVGSTAIPGISAKPILDLIPVVTSLEAFDSSLERITGLGYVSWGANGLPARRYCTLTDPLSGHRLVHLHCYARNSSEIIRHLAFRDYMRAHPEIAHDAEKARCARLHAENSHAYADCKQAWIARTEAAALAWYSARHP